MDQRVCWAIVPPRSITKTTECDHTDDERKIIGTFTTFELKKSIDLGYVITKVEKYASGWPKHVQTNEQKDEFIQNYFDREGVKLKKNEFQKNPGKRQAAKLMLNSLWGKLAQCLDMIMTSIITNPSTFWKLFYDKTQEILDILVVGAGLIVKHKKLAECLEILPTSAVHLAAYTTSHARLKLYSLMEKVGAGRLLYVDTDSLIYEVENREDPLKDDMGEYLGQLADELKGEMLEFVSLGPKKYAYRERLHDGTITTIIP